MNIQSNESLKPLLTACLQGDRSSQKQLYKAFYAYAMSICLRYTQSKEEAQEVLNDGFLKIFTRLESFDFQRPFQAWLRRIMINTAIDFYRKNTKERQTLDINDVAPVASHSDVLNDISEQEILKLVQELPPAYRMVFNLHILEGYQHNEIAEMLGIHEGTSKSNLAKARKHLQAKLQKIYDLR